jgi:hypothetical protein
MSSRWLSPLSVRLPRAERGFVVSYARAHGLSNSALIKLALRQFFRGVDVGVDMSPRNDVPNMAQDVNSIGRRPAPPPAPRSSADASAAAGFGDFTDTGGPTTPAWNKRLARQPRFGPRQPSDDPGGFTD